MKVGSGSGNIVDRAAIDGFSGGFGGRVTEVANELQRFVSTLLLAHSKVLFLLLHSEEREESLTRRGSAELLQAACSAAAHVTYTEVAKVLPAFKYV